MPRLRTLLCLLALSSPFGAEARAETKLLPRFCTRVFHEYAWQVFESCLERPGADLLLCAPNLFQLASAQSRDAAAAAYILRAQTYFQSLGIATRRAPDNPFELVIPQETLGKLSRGAAAFLARAVKRKGAEVSEVRFGPSGIESGFLALYDPVTKHISLTPLGMRALLDRVPHMTILMKHEVDHAQLFALDSALNTHFITRSENGWTTPLQLMPPGYQMSANGQEVYTYSRDIGRMLRFIARRILAGKLGADDFSAALVTLVSGNRSELSRIRDFARGFIAESDIQEKIVLSGEFAFSWDKKTSALSLVSQGADDKTSRYFILWKTPMKSSDFTAVDAPADVARAKDLAGNPAIHRRWAESNIKFAELQRSIDRIALKRLCGLRKVANERLLAVDRLVADATALQTQNGGGFDPEQTAKSLMKLADRFERGIRLPNVARLEKLCPF